MKKIEIDQIHKEEGIDRFKWVSLTEIEKLIKDGQITDGFTIAVYTRAKLHELI